MLLAVVQNNPKIGKINYNIDKVISIVDEANKKGAELILFPEAALTGYCYKSKEEAFTYIPDNLIELATERISSVCRGSIVLIGLLEKRKNDLYNSAIAISSSGLISCYSKTHLPFLGADRFVTKSNSFAGNLINISGRKIGILICYELRFPEVARILALQGAQLICDLSNLPIGAESNIDFIGRTRAIENKAFFALCNRCGTERGVTFIGRSQILSPNGDILASASDNEEILYAKIDISLAIDKSLIKIPGEYELHLFKDRRPELYTILTKKY